MTSHDDVRAITPGAVARCLLEGGVAVLPTDTVYGIAACPRCPAAVERVFELKARRRSVNLPLMFADAGDLEGLGVVISEAARRLLRSPWVPGPLTIAVGLAPDAAPAWLAGRDEIAVRAPDDPWLLAVLRETGPLLVTSANRHGEPVPQTLDGCLAQLDGAPDMAIDGGPRPVIPSTLVNCHVEPPVIEREGVISRGEIEPLLN
jgi:L-threonylcarbamoyladenylate synthase